MPHQVRSHLKSIKITLLIINNYIPVRQKGFHIMNAPAAFTQVFNLIRSFMNEKVRSRIQVLGTDFESLYKVVPQRLLPTEYGGEAGTISTITESWEKKLLENRDYFLNLSTFGTDENKRKGNPKNSESLFGLEGSFRKLDID
jgi:hypothetical protein